MRHVVATSRETVQLPPNAEDLSRIGDGWAAQLEAIGEAPETREEPSRRRSGATGWALGRKGASREAQLNTAAQDRQRCRSQAVEKERLRLENLPFLARFQKRGLARQMDQRHVCSLESPSPEHESLASPHRIALSSRLWLRGNHCLRVP